ncbi:unnamed protein product [Durusdinium trenchii]|uniref:Uncharacterized protein n=1 Tax=Durusdinium trenchii TaxID=1381693 RepID=A0ABP0RJ01_9DINO
MDVRACCIFALHQRSHANFRALPMQLKSWFMRAPPCQQAAGNGPAQYTWSDWVVDIAIDLVLLWVVVVIFARFERIVYAPKQEKVIWGHGAMTVAFDNEGSEDSRSFLQRSWQKMFPSQSSGHFAPHNVSQAYEAAREHQHNLHGHGEQTF